MINKKNHPEYPEAETVVLKLNCKIYSVNIFMLFSGKEKSAILFKGIFGTLPEKISPYPQA
jgi:hypothetical protein